MSSKIQNEIRSRLTEHETNYKRCNLNLIGSYNGLYPSSLSKLSIAIFTQLLSNKMYHKKESRFYDQSEEKRIYTSVPITPSILLENCHPVKYRLEKSDVSNDIGNLVKRIGELDDNNVFYVWRLGHPKNYMFVLERDIGLWKYYNPSAYVTPKTIRKILLSAKGMTNSMLDALQDQNEKLTIHDVRKSFCSFVDRIVSKMNPEVIKSLPIWGEDRGYRDYLNELNKTIATLSPYDGLEEDEQFYERVPLMVQQKSLPKKTSINSHEELSMELAPKNEDLTKPKAKKKEKIITQEQKLETFKLIEPLKNVKSFFQYYRSMILYRNNNAKFHTYEIELGNAAVILDIIKESGHGSDFLSAWINYYFDTKLKGDYAEKQEKTSLKAFKETFEEYNSRYIGCGV